MLRGPGLVAHAVALLQIAAGTKRAFPGAGQDDTAGIARVHGQRFETMHQVGRHLGIEGVCKLGPIQRDLQNLRDRVCERERGVIIIGHTRWHFVFGFGTI